MRWTAPACASLLVLAGCASLAARRPDDPPDDGHDATCAKCEAFVEPHRVDAGSCVTRASVEALVQRGELRTLSIAAPTSAEAETDNATALYLRVEIASSDAGYQMQLDAVGRGGAPGYSGMPMRGLVTLERVYADDVEPDAMTLCDGRRGSERDPRGAWCTDTDIRPGLQALRVVAPGTPPLELRRPEQPPEIAAYVADSPDGRILVRLRSDTAPFRKALMYVRRVHDSIPYQVPIARSGDPECFYDLRGTSHFQVPFHAAVFTPFSAQSIGTELALPEAVAEHRRFGPVQQLDFDLLLQAHAAWLGFPTVRVPSHPRAWQDMPVNESACQERPTTPARAVLDGVDLAGLQLESKLMQRASLRDAGLADASLDMSNLCGADLSGADLRRARAARIVLQGAVLERADARRSDLRGKMAGASFRAADLREANLGGSLVGADLSETDLRGARIYGDLSRANLHAARLDGAKLVGANLRTALGLTQPQLDVACGDRQTKLPPGLAIGACE